MRSREVLNTSQGFPKSNRLLKWRNFHFKGIIFRSSPLKVSFKKNLLDDSRLGIVVSKKISKSAVIRNKVKRILREAFRKSLIKNLKLDLVFIVTKPFNESDNYCDHLKRAFLQVEKEILWAQTKKEV